MLSGDELQRKYRAHDRLILFYIGAVCLIIAITLLAFFLFRKDVFAVYLGYLICISLWIVSHYGYLFPLAYPGLPAINEIVKPLSSLGAAFFLVTLLGIVFRQHLEFHKRLRQVITFTRYLLPAISLCMLLLVIHNLPAPVKASLLTLWHIALLFSIYLIILIPVYFIHSGTVAKIFSAAMLVICIMSVVHLLGNSGYINNYFINEHGIAISSLIENFIIAFGLFYGILQENNERKNR